MPMLNDTNLETRLDLELPCKDPDWGKWPNVPDREAVSFTQDASQRLIYVSANMDLDLMARVEIELFLPAFHRRPLLARMLLWLGWNCILTARFDNLEMDVQYIEFDGYFVVLNVWISNPRRPAACRVPCVPIPWDRIPLYKEHVV